MQHKDLTEFAKLMMILSEVFDGGKVPSELKMEIYFEALKGYDIEILKQGVTKIITTRVYPAFPKPGEIMAEISGKQEDKALLAWIQVIDAMKQHGPYQSVRFKDETIHAVVEFMGGWPALGDWTNQELVWKQKEFERLYGIMKERPGRLDHLPGLCEIDNSMKEYDIDKVIEIGDAPTRKMQIVYRRIDGGV